jgi:hypothetical protein
MREDMMGEYDVCDVMGDTMGQHGGDQRPMMGKMLESHDEGGGGLWRAGCKGFL